MNPQAFADLVDAIQGWDKRVLTMKGNEYAPRADRLENFKVSAALQRTTPEKALMGMLAKHLVSIADLVNGVEEPPCPHGDAPMCPCPAWKPTDLDVWREKLGDARLYLILLEALVSERLLPLITMCNHDGPPCPVGKCRREDEERPDGLGPLHLDSAELGGSQ